MLQPKQESRFEYKGFPCVVLFMPIGYRCGYVGLPKENKYYGKKYNDIPIACHCGLTYARKYLFGQEDKETWWIGFDCGHACDGIDTETFRKLYEKELMETEPLYADVLVKNLRSMAEIKSQCLVYTRECVENECKNIVDQILELSKTKKGGMTY